MPWSTKHTTDVLDRLPIQPKNDAPNPIAGTQICVQKLASVLVAKSVDR